MNILITRLRAPLVAALVLTGSLVLAGTAFAATPTAAAGWPTGHGGGVMRPGVVGTVASVSGDTLTVTSKPFAFGRGGHATSTPATTSTTYTVDATNAKVTKNGAISSVSAIATGDMVFVMGSVSGTSVSATSIIDGMMQGGMGKGPVPSKPANPPFTGNGEPVVGGSVSAITGATLTLAAQGGVTYSVDASNATVFKMGTTTLASILVGDDVVVQGAVSGSSVTASTVLDQGAPKAAGAPPSGRGVIGVIGGFFTRLFGFF